MGLINENFHYTNIFLNNDLLTPVAFNSYLTPGYFRQSILRNFGKWFWRTILVFSSKPWKYRCSAKSRAFSASAFTPILSSAPTVPAALVLYGLLVARSSASVVV